MARYLITGGAGFIGSHLAKSLVLGGHVVRVLDNLSSGRVENLPRGVELITADVREQAAVRRGLDAVDGCFHLAAVASVEQCQADWRRSHSVNIGGTITVFEEVHRGQVGCGRPLPVVYASSAAVYGNASDTPLSEDTPPRPVSAYAIDKLGCELHAAAGARACHLAAVGLRFFNVYGPRQDPNSPYSGVIPIFCQRTLQGAAVELHGDGTQVRDFIYVEDAVAALRQAMVMAGPAPQIYNVCTGIGTEIRRLAELIAQIYDLPLRLQHAPPRLDDLRASIGDPRRAQDKLGFSARISLREGLVRTVASITLRANRDSAGRDT